VGLELLLLALSQICLELEQVLEQAQLALELEEQVLSISIRC
jgi:hypothetical protein